MKLSQLQLQHYHFYRLSLVSREKVNVEHQLDALYPELKGEDVTTTVELLANPKEKDPHEFIVRLTVKSALTDSDDHFPYDFDTLIEGLFVIDHDGDLDERRHLVICNGASVLYGSVREQLLSLSARHRYGAMMLPTATFLDLQLSEPAKKKPVRAPKTKSPE